MTSSTFAATSPFPSAEKLPNTSAHYTLNRCFRSTEGIVAFAASSMTSLLLFLPLFILVLFFRFQQWRRQRSSVSHSDHFLCHSMFMRLYSFMGFTFFFCGGCIHLQQMMSAGLFIWTGTTFGQTLLHLFTCVDRYLAVVRPITYLGLKRAGGARLRDASIGCGWLLCGGWPAMLYLSPTEVYLILDHCISVLNVFIISFCSISVLCVLKRPGPGEVGGNRERVDQTKQRAFYTIMVIMAALLFRFGGKIMNNIMYSSETISPGTVCLLIMSDIWFELPSSLVLPLLFLHRRQKLRCYKQTTESG